LTFKTLFLTDNFPPEVNAPANRTFEHCREWVKAGHQVTVITCAIFMICVLLFRRGIVGEILARFSRGEGDVR